MLQHQYETPSSYECKMYFLQCTYQPDICRVLLTVKDKAFRFSLILFMAFLT